MDKLAPYSTIWKIVEDRKSVKMTKVVPPPPLSSSFEQPVKEAIFKHIKADFHNFDVQ